MKWSATLSFLTFSLLTGSLYSEEVVRIEIGRDYQQYSHADLQRRVWELERAVWQLQQRVFQLEAGKPPATPDQWICTIKAMGNTHTGTGSTKATAMSQAIGNCKAANGGDGFFCKEPHCQQ